MGRKRELGECEETKLRKLYLIPASSAVISLPENSTPPPKVEQERSQWRDSEMRERKREESKV